MTPSNPSLQRHRRDAGRANPVAGAAAAVAPPPAGEAASAPPKSRLSALTIAAIGVVYGDIGTSPLYTMRLAFGPHGVLPLTETSVLGVLSLVAWALFTIVTLKYVIVILRADNRGEGGILALSTLAQRQLSPRGRRTVLVLAMVGAALFYGDGLITPAITVLSAIEGLEVATPLFEPYVVPFALVILTGLFLMQSRGTGNLGLLFGPVMCLWFIVLGVLGLVQIFQAPHILRALDPSYALALFEAHQWLAFVTLGAVFLAVTGAEALYADMGHFGRLPIRIAWFGLVLPGLLLNYFGQGALLLANPGAAANPFYLLAPAWALYPMVVLATWATVIASQAVISGVFSISGRRCSSAICRGSPCATRRRRRWARSTSRRSTGCCSPALSCWSSASGPRAISPPLTASRSAAPWRSTPCSPGSSCAIGWGWRPALVVAVFGAFLAIDLTFLSANALKMFAGGWFPLVMAAAVFVADVDLAARPRRSCLSACTEARRRCAPSSPACRCVRRPACPAPRCSSRPIPPAVPHALLHNLKHNKVLHERIVVLKVETEDVPRVPTPERLEVEHLGANFCRVGCATASWTGRTWRPR